MRVCVLSFFIYFLSIFNLVIFDAQIPWDYRDGGYLLNVYPPIVLYRSFLIVDTKIPHQCNLKLKKFRFQKQLAVIPL